jgi:bacterioferritin-associated ferredoxin
LPTSACNANKSHLLFNLSVPLVARRRSPADSSRSSFEDRIAAVIVCVCHRVSDRDIRAAARQGIASFDALQHALGVGTACGSCLDCARDTWSRACGCSAAGRAAAAVQDASGSARPAA